MYFKKGTWVFLCLKFKKVVCLSYYIHIYFVDKLGKHMRKSWFEWRYKMKGTKQLKFLTIGILSVLIFLWCMRSFCLTWVEVNDQYAEITVNFLVPMERTDIEKYIRIESEFPTETNFDYTYEWLNKSVLSLKVKEKNQICGQKVKIHIQKANSNYEWITKTAHIPVQFKAPVQIITPTTELLIASNNSFLVQFNTPMNLNKISKYIQSDTPFTITPAERTDEDGKVKTDTTRFIFTPNQVLENNKEYKIAFKKGMPSKSGNFLETTQYVTLKTDVKPQIISTYPKDQDKWIGLYPRITITTDKPVVKAIMQLGENKITGKLTDSYHATFVLSQLLKPDTAYDVAFQVQAASGEKSDVKYIRFTSTTLTNNRIWLEMTIGTPSVIKVYKGEKLIREMSCSVGKDQFEPTIGTYYLQGKEEVYEDDKHEEGANYWLPISNQFGFQGVIRDDSWQIKNCSGNTIGARTDRNNIILEEIDAKWMYENLPIEAMIIIRK